MERFAALLDRQLRGRSESATEALEDTLGRRRLIAAGQIVGEFASTICVKGDWRERTVPSPFPCDGLPPMP